VTESSPSELVRDDQSRVSEQPEPVKRRRRLFAASEKLRILQESMQLAHRGDLAELLRRESIYSSHLAAWRKAYQISGEAGLHPAKPGRKPKFDWRDGRIRELEHRVELLERELERLNAGSKSVAASVTEGGQIRPLPEHNAAR